MTCNNINSGLTCRPSIGSSHLRSHYHAPLAYQACIGCPGHHVGVDDCAMDPSSLDQYI
jgi:hypothetical protein